MKPINLISLLNAKNSLKPEVFDSYLSGFEVKIKESEIEDLRSLCKQIIDIEHELAFWIVFTLDIQLIKLERNLTC